MAIQANALQITVVVFGSAFIVGGVILLGMALLLSALRSLWFGSGR